MKTCPRCRSCYDDEFTVCAIDDTPLEGVVAGPRLIDGKYRLERVLGSGATGIVFRARHIGLEKAFAVKLVQLHQTDPDALAHFRLEAATLGRLKHPNIVDVTDFGVDGRAAPLGYLVMEFLEGRTLAEACHAAPLPLDIALDVLDQIAAAVDHAHANGIVHRDLKPSNILLQRLGDGRVHAKVLDFGLAQFIAPLTEPISSSASTTGRSAGILRPSFRVAREEFLDIQRREEGWIVGTRGYIAPEVVRREAITQAVDIFAFGVIAFELLTGAKPFAGDHLERDQHVALPSTLNPALPADIDQPLLETLASAPAERPQMASPAARRIREAIDAEGERRRAAVAREVADREAAAEAEALNQRRRRARTARTQLAVAAAAAVLVGSAVAWTSELLQQPERRLIDARFGSARPRPADSGLVLVSIDDATLAADARPLAALADDFASAIDRLFQSGARAIAVDLLLPENWSQSPAFASAVLQHPNRLTLAALSRPDGPVVGPESVSGLVTAVLGPDAAGQLFGLANLPMDPDGVTRRGVVQFHDTRGERRATFAGRAVQTYRGEALPADRTDSDAFPVDFRIDAATFRKVSWGDLDATLRREPDLVRDRLILIGAEFAGSGDADHRVPPTGRVTRISGLTVQALVVNTLLDRLPIRAVSSTAVLLLTSGVVTAVLLLTAWSPNAVRPLVAAVIAGAVCYEGFGLAMFTVRGIVFPLVPPLATLLVGAAIAAGLSRVGMLREARS